MTLATGAWGQDTVAQNGKDMRELVEGLVGVTGLGTRPGFTSGFKATAQGSPNATVSVAAGHALVAATGAGLLGQYHVWNDAALTSGSFAPTAGNGRWDYLILRVTNGVPALEIVQGTASGSPVAPSITGDNFLPIALVKLPASTSAVTNAMITEAREFTGRWTEPRGLIDYVTLTTSTGSFTGGVLCTSVKTYVANRRIRLTGLAVVQMNSTGAIVNASIEEQGIGNLCNSGFTVGTNGWFVTCNPGCVITPTAGSHTYRLTFAASSGTMSAAASTTQPNWLCIEDIGAATATPD
jgi:hypothetical protein